MKKVMPIKRHEALQPFSREHHHGLLLCWKIKTGLQKGVEIDRIKKYADWMYNTHLKRHFKLEEQYVFPILKANDELILQALKQHQNLRLLFEDRDHVSESLSAIQRDLDAHIRFEERILFKAVQLVASPEQFQKMTEMHQEARFVENETDVFWL